MDFRSCVAALTLVGFARRENGKPAEDRYPQLRLPIGVIVPTARLPVFSEDALLIAKGILSANALITSIYLWQKCKMAAMKSHAAVGVSLVLLLAMPLFGQQMDARLRGEWNLSLEKSTFGPGSAPKSGHVSWTEHGWVFAIVTPGGGVYADAVITDNGCAMIGVAPQYSCQLDVLAPRHLRFTMKQGAEVRRVGDIELLDKDTTKTTHRVTPKDGEPYTETTIWVRGSE